MGEPVHGVILGRLGSGDRYYLALGYCTLEILLLVLAVLLVPSFGKPYFRFPTTEVWYRFAGTSAWP